MKIFIKSYGHGLVILICVFFIDISAGFADNTMMRSLQADHTIASLGFAGKLLITSDPDWKEKWNTPTNSFPKFIEKERFGLGESFTILTLYINPSVDQKNYINIICDMRLIQPGGKVSLEQQDMVCANEEMIGDSQNIRMAYAILEFDVELGDPFGIWTVEVTLKDMSSQGRVFLRRQLEIVRQATMVRL